MSRSNDPAREPDDFLDLLTLDMTAGEGPDAGELRELRETAAAIAMEIPRRAPPEPLRARVLQAVKQEPRAAASNDAGWSATGQPGVSLKVLFQDPGSGLLTMLLRMSPGSSFPAHYHSETEQCYVVQGDVRWRDLIYRAGDFVVAPKGSIHPPITTVEGNILLLVAGRNELRLEYQG
ncbi:MAG: cupin domain-containing protein [Acidobacteria bacterium]|nr:cupin domain-containing protein [Acidobacteriota bacterium]